MTPNMIWIRGKLGHFGHVLKLFWHHMCIRVFRLWHWKHTPTQFMSRYSWSSNMCQHSVKIEQLLLISFGKERGGYYVCSLPVVAYIFIEWYTFTTISIHVFPVLRNYVLLDLVYPQYGTLVSLDECVSVLNQI